MNEANVCKMNIKTLTNTVGEEGIKLEAFITLNVTFVCTSGVPAALLLRVTDVQIFLTLINI